MKLVLKPVALSVFVWILLAAMLSSCSSTGPKQLVGSGLVLDNVTVVSTRDGSLAPKQALLIQDGKVTSVVAAGTLETTGTAQWVDGTGKYLVPGFLDMHVHSLQAADKPVTFWPLLIANGITGVREMAGSAALIQRVKKLNEDSAAGRVDAPEVLQVPGELFGAPLPPPRLQQMVRDQKEQGASFIKLVGSSRDGALAILAQAKQSGLGVAGHIPLGISALEASNAGMRAIEHAGAGLTLLLDCSTEEAAVRQAMLAGGPAPFNPLAVLSPMLLRAPDAPFFQRVMNSYNADKCAALAKTFAANGTWQVPTLIRLRTMNLGGDNSYRTDPNLKYVEPATRALWERLGQQFATTMPATAAQTFAQYYAWQQKLPRLMQDNGVKMLTGSDLGGIWVVPGFSLHQEFKELATGGLSPLQILQMATLNGAEFLDRQSSMGTVEAGKNADLVLLDANPLESADNLGKISGVFLRGKYFNKAALDKLKSDVEAAYK